MNPSSGRPSRRDPTLTGLEVWLIGTPGDKRPAFPDHPADLCTATDPRCRTAGRHIGWEARATTDPDRIRKAWTRAPYNVGIACGPSGLLVVDLDVPKPGQQPPAPWIN